MPLTPEQRAGVRRWLGYPDVGRFAHHALEGAMVALSGEGAEIIVTLLEQLEALDAVLRSAWARMKVIKAEDVTLAGQEELQALRQEGRRLVAQLAAVLDVQPRRSMFGGGDSTSGVGRRGA